MRFTKILSRMLVVLAVGVFCACGGDDGNGGAGGDIGTNNGKAPSGLRGHKFNFFYEYGGELYRSVSFFQDEDGTFEFLSYSATYMFDAQLKQCIKTASDMMHIEIQSTFQSGEIGDYWEGTQYQDSEHSYTFDLRFIDNDQGIAYVTETKYALDYWGKWGKQTTESVWYFRMDSDIKPDKNLIDGMADGGNLGQGSDEGDTDGEENTGPEGGTEVSANDLFVDISSIYPTYLYYHVEYANPAAYTDPDDYLSVGVCYGTSPNPTVFDSVTLIEIVRPNSDSYAVMSGLASNTTYYMRPFREVNGSIMYYRETSVKTPGIGEDSDVMLKLTYLYDQTMEMEYSINVEGTFKIELWTWDLQGGYSPYDIGYKTKGDKGSVTYKWNGYWRDTRYFYLVAENVETGQQFRSDNMYADDL